jgi:flagellar hook-basal body complex protein FliE
MHFFSKLIEFFTMGSGRPMRRLVAYYTVVALCTLALLHFLPVVDQLFSGERINGMTTTPQLLQDGLNGNQFETPVINLPPRLELAITTTLIIVATLVLMLPVTWVYMSSRRTKGFNQSVVQTILILPIVVAGIVLIVRNSVALAFSLAGIVAGVRFRNTLRDARDTVFVFLAIAVGLAAGVQALTVAALLSVFFNFVILLVWRYDFGRNVLEPTASSQWTESLTSLAQKNGGSAVPDRDLMLALTPRKARALAERFARVRQILGPDGKKPRFNAVLSITTNSISEAQQQAEKVLDQVAKKWKLDEVVSNEGKPSELYYLVRVRKSSSREDILTAIHVNAGNKIVGADIEMGDVQAAEEKPEKAEKPE